MMKEIRIFFVALIIFIMSKSAHSQETASSDRIQTSAGFVELVFVGHGSLMFRLGEYVIHIDPVKSSGNYEKLPAADLILVTHDHYDHLDEGLIGNLWKGNTLMFCNSSSASRIKGAIAMKAGDKRETGVVKVEATEAYNIVNERSPGQPFHPKGYGIGFIITIGDKRFYIAGDTENIPEMKALANIDVAFLPMNLPYTMTPEMVADAVKSFKPLILYPYHYGDTDTNRIVELLRGSSTEVRIRNLK